MTRDSLDTATKQIKMTIDSLNRAKAEFNVRLLNREREYLSKLQELQNNYFRRRTRMNPPAAEKQTPPVISRLRLAHKFCCV